MSLTLQIALRSYIRILTILLFITISGNTEPALAQQADSSSVSGSQIRMPSEERLIEISQDERYQYNELKEELSPWQRFILWLQNILGKWITSEGMLLFLRITGSMLFILIIVLLVNQIMKGELGSAIRNRHDRPLLNLQHSANGMNNRKLYQLLDEAIQKGNYPMAVRYLYQIALVLLREKELILWASDKTNYDYLTELSGHPSEDSFNRLTYFHEYVDYGDFTINEQQFTTIRTVFNDFKQRLESS